MIQSIRLSFAYVYIDLNLLYYYYNIKCYGIMYDRIKWIKVYGFYSFLLEFLYVRLWLFLQRRVFHSWKLYGILIV